MKKRWIAAIAVSVVATAAGIGYGVSRYKKCRRAEPSVEIFDADNIDLDSEEIILDEFTGFVQKELRPELRSLYIKIKTDLIISEIKSEMVYTEYTLQCLLMLMAMVSAEKVGKIHNNYDTSFNVTVDVLYDAVDRALMSYPALEGKDIETPIKQMVEMITKTRSSRKESIWKYF